jgi:diaminopimelate epimerase
MTLNFTKMHGCGNDVVVVNALDALRAWQPSAAQAAFLLDRHFGVGGDQLLLLYPSTTAAARMAIYNPDGSAVEMCGNGIRCCARYLHQRGLVADTTMTIATPAGLITPTIVGEQVRVNMGAPRLLAEEIPVRGYTGRVIGVAPPAMAGDYALPPMTCVSMGNPHAVFFVPDVAAVPLAAVGANVETLALFPRRTNVEFAQVLTRGQVRLRVWERGAGITLACGTGACGTAVAGILNKMLDSPVDIALEGGTLTIAWPDQDGPVWMTGPAVEVFAGTIEVPGP